MNPQQAPSAASGHHLGWLDPTFVEGIGPPLEQIEQDYRELVDSTCGGMAQDVLALIKEVKVLRWELAK